MPKIPDLQEGQRVGASSPVPIASSSGARAEGENLARLGQSMFNFGLVQQARQKTRLNLLKEQFREAGQRAFLETMKDPEASPDGGDTLDNFQKRYAEKISGIDTSIVPKAMRKELEAVRLGVSNNFTQSLINEDLARFDKFRAQTVDTSITSLTTDIDLNPEMVNDHFNQFRETIEGLGYSDNEKEQFLKLGENAATGALVSSFVNRDMYGEARKVLSSPLASKLSEKERTGLMKRIDDTQFQTSQRKYQEEERARLQEERRVKALQDRNFSELLGGVLSDKFEERQMTLKRADSLLASQGLSQTQWKALRTTDKDVLTRDDQDTYGRYIGRIYAERNFDNIGKDVTADVAAKILKPSTARTIMGMVEKQRNARTSLPSGTRMSLQNKRQEVQNLIGKDAPRNPITGMPQITDPRRLRLLEESLTLLTDAAHRGRGELNSVHQNILRRLGADPDMNQTPRGVRPERIRTESGTQRELIRTRTLLKRAESLRNNSPQQRREYNDLLKRYEQLMDIFENQKTSSEIEQEIRQESGAAQRSGPRNRRFGR